jgi:hypothetical protein
LGGRTPTRGTHSTARAARLGSSHCGGVLQCSSRADARSDPSPTIVLASGCGSIRRICVALKRKPPDVRALIRVLNNEGVRYVVTGSAAAMLHGVALEPGDLDITPARDEDNLWRLARVLELIEAHHDPDAPFGQWERADDGEQRWVQREPTAEDMAARAAWRPDPADVASFDYLLQSKYGAIDIVPEVSGTYQELMLRAVEIKVDSESVLVEAIHDLLSTITVPRREKDRDRVRQLRAIQRTRPE